MSFYHVVKEFNLCQGLHAESGEELTSAGQQAFKGYLQYVYSTPAHHCDECYGTPGILSPEILDHIRDVVGGPSVYAALMSGVSLDAAVSGSAFEEIPVHAEHPIETAPVEDTVVESAVELEQTQESTPEAVVEPEVASVAEVAPEIAPVVEEPSIVESVVPKKSTKKASA